MSANIFKQVSTASTNLTRIKQFGANIKGWCIINTNAAARFVKFYFFLPGTGGADAPTVGTTIPDITVEVPGLGATTGNSTQSFPDGLSNKGDLWMATTVNPAVTDATAVGANDLIMSIFVE